MLGCVLRSACSCAAASAATAVARHDCCVVVVDLVVAVAVTLVLLSLLIAVLLLQLLLSLQDMLVVFFFKHQADVSSTGRIWWEIAHLGWHRPLVVNVNFAGNLVVAAKNLGGALHPWLAPSIAWKCSLLLGS